MVKLGFLGAGIISECHYYAVEKLKNIQIAAIASIDADDEKTAKKYKAKFYKDYKKLLNKEKKLDGIVIALPNFMHCEAAEYAINAGHKNILCEKPLARNPEEAGRVVKLVREKDVLFQTAYMKRFNPGFRLMKESLPQIGEIEFVTAGIFSGGSDPETVRRNSGQKPKGGTWHNDPELSGGGFLAHSGSHHIDLLRYLFGDIKSVECKLRFIYGVNDDYFVNGKLHTNDGVEITMRLGRVDVGSMGPGWEPLHKQAWNEFVEVIGTKGYLRVDNPNWRGWDVMKFTRWISGMAGPETRQLDCAEQWVNEFAAFSESCETGKLAEQATTVVDGYRTDRILEQMRLSDKQDGKLIEVKYEW